MTSSQFQQAYLTEERSIQALSMRGIVRIWCAKVVPRILHFLTECGYVNCGLMTSAPRPFPFVGSIEKKVSIHLLELVEGHLSWTLLSYIVIFIFLIEQCSDNWGRYGWTSCGKPSQKFWPSGINRPMHYDLKSAACIYTRQGRECLSRMGVWECHNCT